MVKPKIVLEIESIYKIKLKQHKKKYHFSDHQNRLTYDVDSANNLISLNLVDSFFSDVKILKNEKKLQFLNLCRCPVNDFSFLKNFKELLDLDISSTKATNIDFLKSIDKLTSLNISETDISDISPLFNLHNLRSLSLTRTSVEDFSIIKNLTNLVSVDAWSCAITDGDVFCNLLNLSNLSLWDNNIRNLDFLDGLKNLSVLDIGKNPIEDFTPIANLRKLVGLEIDNCGLLDISFLKDLKALKRVNLNFNSIEKLEGLRDLEKLESLNLVRNKIIDLEPLKDLKSLKTITLSNNKVSDLRPLEGFIRRVNPEISFEESFFGEGLNISNNYTTVPPLEVLVQGNSTILQYFEDAKKYGIKELNECKLILLGNGELGKTSLMKKIVGLPFTDEVTTHGINKKTWCEIKNNANEDIKVNLWDFGGQHIQHSLHQFFLTEKVVYILLLNPRNDTNAMYWLEQINKLGKDSEILIVYNWKDVKDKESHSIKNFYELRKTYPNLREPYLLSCKTGEGFENFKNDLVQIILNQQDLFVQYPLNWYKIKNQLEENVTINKNYISYKDYDEICTSNHYSNEINKKNLLKQLDKIGSIVFFDKPILNDLQVLNPDWITTGAYSVITSEITNEKKGHLNYNDLLEIFKEEKSLFANEEIKLKYRANDFLFILALMTEYDICVMNPFVANEYLIPCAFEGEKPEQFEVYKKNSIQYRFRFESAFEMLIMYRFMARNISKCVTKNGYWQSGILLKDSHTETFALVETNQYSKVIDFWLTGVSIREFWGVLRRDIKDINTKYSLKFEEEVLYKNDQESESVFLSYDEMVNSLFNGVRILAYHPIHKMFNIDVLKVIENFEDSSKIIKEMNKNKISFDVKGDFVNNSQMQIGGSNNSQKNFVNNYNDNLKIEELKLLLEEFEDLILDNIEWQKNFENALKEIYRLEEAKDEIDEKKSVSKLKRFFQKAKDLKDLIAIGVLPAEIATKGGKMLELAKGLFGVL